MNCCATCLYARPWSDDQVRCALASSRPIARPSVGPGSGCPTHHPVSKAASVYPPPTVEIPTPEDLRSAKGLTFDEYMAVLNRAELARKSRT